MTAEQASFCETLRKANAPVTSMPGLHCDLPNGGDKDSLRVIRITYSCASASTQDGAPAVASTLEQSLADTGKADVHSIYFSFDSDVIRDESAPTLKEIADTLNRHATWKLAVNGHTDGLGGNERNLDLSKRRAAAVKDALTKRYGINADRLATAGFGKAQPIDSNDTLEGRARNRRVELIRLP